MIKLTKFINMEKSTFIVFSPEEKAKQLEAVMQTVKKQVKQYRLAKKNGTLRKVTEATNTYLFNV